MKDQLLLLQKLQDIDTRTKEIRLSIESVPAALNPAKQDLQKLETMLEMEREQIAQTEKLRSEQEGIVTSEQDALKKAKAKLQDAKNARDFSAASREIDNKKRSIHEREQEVLKLYEALEVGKEKLAAHEEDVQKLRDHVAAEEAKFADVLEELKKRAEEAMQGRADIEAKIEPSLIKRYNMVIQRRGDAVATVKGGVCQGCHMSLPPQLAIQVAKGESIQSCRQCNRLLYPLPESEENAAEA